MKATFFILLLACLAPRLALANSGSEITFIQVGLIHNYHLDPQYHYPPSTLSAIVEATRPDLICGEAIESQWQLGLAGLFPFENRILEFAGRKVGASFVPVDWRTTYQEAADVLAVIKKYLSAEFTASARQERDRLDEEFEKTFTAHAGAGFFRYLHTEFWKDAGSYHTRSERFFGDAPDGFWYRRNANIAHQCYEAAKARRAKRVLVAYGAEHQYVLNALLGNMPNARSVRLGEIIPLQRLTLRPGSLPKELKLTLTDDLERLRKYVSHLPIDSPEKAELEKKRIPGLEKLLQRLFPEKEASLDDTPKRPL